MPRPRLVWLVLAALVLAPLAACRPTELAGDSIGEYRVTGALAETTCGAGHPAPASMSFYVELRAEPGSTSGYWKLPNAGLVAGELDEGAFRFEQRSQVVGVPQDLEAGVAGCMLERAEIVAGELGSAPAADAGSTGDAGAQGDGDAEGFHGRTTIGVSPVAGGDCSPLLIPFGGAFPVLPCELRYDLTGERVEEPVF